MTISVKAKYAKANLTAGLGGPGNDNLVGTAGNDTLDGAAGADTMTGGDGSDKYYVDTAEDRVIESNPSKAGGTDTVYASASYVLGSNVENLRINSTGHVNATGNELANILYAGAGNNILNGGGGTDTASYAYTSGGVNVSLAAAGDQATGNSGSDNLVSIENLTGSNYNDVLTGNDGNNVIKGGKGADHLNGGAGSDTLDGGIGADAMIGGSGSDLFYVDNSEDTVTEVISGASGGTDTVYASVNFTLGANVENLRINSTGHVNATGNELANILYAGAGNNILNGGGGTDTASYAYTSGGVNVSLAMAGDQATGNSGSDNLFSIENLIGSNYNDVLTGDDGNNVIKGGAGNDHLIGGAGDDTLVGGAGQDLLTGGDWADVFDFNALSEMGTSSANWDSISDFDAGKGDKIDLATLDANTSLAGNQKFNFIGSSSFTAAGQVRYDAAAGVLFGNVDGDLNADFAIHLIGAPALDTGNLIA